MPATLVPSSGSPLPHFLAPSSHPAPGLALTLESNSTYNRKTDASLPLLAADERWPLDWRPVEPGFQRPVERAAAPVRPAFSMRIVPVILISTALGIVLGFGATWTRYRLAAETWTGKPAWQVPTGPAPKVVVDRAAHDFGFIERDSTVRHLFRFTNAGGSDLHLKKGTTSCMKCTISDLMQDTVKPGETVDVAVEYHASLPPAYDDFKQEATILTDDPERPRVTLTVFGKIISAFHVVPTDLVLSKVRTDEAKTSEVSLYSLVETPVQIDGYEWSDLETAPCFEVKFPPIPDDELKAVGAKSGMRVSVTVHPDQPAPGLPLGTVTQKLRLSTNLPGGRSIEIPIFAKIESDISIAGPLTWNAKDSVLGLGHVSSKEGRRGSLQIQLLGPQRHDVQFAVEKVVPDFLRVNIGKPVDASDGETVRIPLTIEIPPGSPPSNYLGTQQAKLGEVLLSTTHPQAKQLKLSVRFAVEH